MWNKMARCTLTLTNGCRGSDSAHPFWIGSLWAHGLGGEDAHSQKREVLIVLFLLRERALTRHHFFSEHIESHEGSHKPLRKRSVKHSEEAHCLTNGVPPFSKYSTSGIVSARKRKWNGLLVRIVRRLAPIRTRQVSHRFQHLCTISSLH